MGKRIPMKRKDTNPKINRRTLEEASEWFVDFRVDDVDAAGRERFDEWLRRSPEHIRAYWEIARTYVELLSPSDTGKVDIDTLIAYSHSESNVVRFNAGTPSSTARPTALPRAGSAIRRSPRRRRFAAAAACGLLATVIFGLWWHSKRYPLYSTDIGERRSLTLVDGSTVDLNASSSVRVEFSKAEREVELLNGQALFQVAKDKHRPFIVRSGEATVRAVGTQFDVYRQPSGTTITVLEGRVVVYSSVHEIPEAAVATHALIAEGKARHSSNTDSTNVSTSDHEPHASDASGGAPSVPVAAAIPTNESAANPVFLSAGEQVIVTPRALPVPQRADLTATMAWMQRRLTFDGSKLSDVVAEFNRYNQRQLIIEGKELSDFHVSGVYSSTDPASLLRFLREQPGVRIIETDTEVRIVPR